jgi:hypothetical protein
MACVYVQQIWQFSSDNLWSVQEVSYSTVAFKLVKEVRTLWQGQSASNRLYHGPEILQQDVNLVLFNTEVTLTPNREAQWMVGMTTLDTSLFPSSLLCPTSQPAVTSTHNPVDRMDRTTGGEYQEHRNSAGDRRKRWRGMWRRSIQATSFRGLSIRKCDIRWHRIPSEDGDGDKFLNTAVRNSWPTTLYAVHRESLSYDQQRANFQGTVLMGKRSLCAGLN